MDEEVTRYEENTEYEYKREKIQALKDLGIDPYNGSFVKLMILKK